MRSQKTRLRAHRCPDWLRALFSLVLGAMLLAAGAAHAQGSSDTITYIHTDISGSPLAATDANGAVLWKESYRGYGQRWLYQGSSAGQPQWFHGKEQDAATGWQYFGARYYDPAVGRFMGIDPVDFQGGDLHSFNRFAYGNNNPVKYLDPDGRHPILIAMGIGAVVGAGSASLTSAIMQYMDAGSLSGIQFTGFGGVFHAAAEGAMWGTVLGPLGGGQTGAAAGVVSGGSRAASAVKSAPNFSRELKASDLGVKGNLQELRGTFAVKDGVANMRVDMIRGEIQNPLQVVGNMAEAARAGGATTLRVEGTIANERLYNVLQNRYGITSSGATDSFTIPLK